MTFLARMAGAVFLVVLLWAAPASAADQNDIRESIDRGVAYLKKSQDRAGVWHYAGSQLTVEDRQSGEFFKDVGATALAALTLLECGVGADDLAVQKAAQVVRDASYTLTYTYAISLSIMLFDRLGDPNDVPLIESLMVRLLAGQKSDGTWSYDCPPINEVEIRRLKGSVQFGRRAGGERETGGRRSYQDLAPEIREQLGQIAERLPAGDAGDNSNTQFAVLALWIGRRQGLPVKTALSRVRDHYRKTQLLDGSWNYRGIAMLGKPPDASMTCAGLIGLAVSFGLANELSPAADGSAEAEASRSSPRRKQAATKKSQPAPDPNRDSVVRAGLIALGSVLERALVGAPPNANRQMPTGNLSGGTPPGATGGQNVTNNYFLFSLERVAVAYGLDTIGNKDWYNRGTAVLLSGQNPDGSWRNTFTGDVAATSFALLFLRRANLAPDLSVVLKGRVKDPGTVKLTAGGVGGAGLKSGQSRPITDLSTQADSVGNAKRSSRPKVTLEEIPQVVKPQEEPSAAAAPSEPDDIEREAARLRTELIKAPKERQAALIAKLEASKGPANTLALASAIPQLTGPIHKTARDALAGRMARMTAATLRDKLRDESQEVRRAAALACAMKEDKGFVPDLIKLLGDPQLSVVLAAHAALKSLTGENVELSANAGDDERSRAVTKWQEWWATHGKK
jgi:hypothetical protein